MQFYHTVFTDHSFEETVVAVTEALKKEGFGVLTHIDMAAKMKEKVNADMRKYVILGACNPPLAYRALQIENKIGVMLPCNVIVRESDNGKIEVSTIDPMATMAAIGSTTLITVAEEVSQKLKRVLESL